MSKVDPEVYEKVMQAYGYRCAECFSGDNIELHHLLPRSRWRVKKYKHFIDSPFNLVPLGGNLGCGCHEKHKSKYKITDRQAEVYEWWLREVNNEN